MDAAVYSLLIQGVEGEPDPPSTSCKPCAGEGPLGTEGPAIWEGMQW